MHLNYRKTCRSCGLPTLRRVIDLGNHHLQGMFAQGGRDVARGVQRRVPMSLVRCDPAVHERGCGLLQTEHGVPPELMYEFYWYRSGTNASMRDHLKGIVEQVTDLQRGETSLALDIGCNDGTLLSNYPRSVEKWGIDPSNLIPESDDNCTYVRDFFPSRELVSRKPGIKFDAITSIAMFYDLEEPGRFVSAIKELLHPKGLWVVEVSYMPKMLSQGSYDSICHEHLLYFSFASLENLITRHELKVVRAEFNSMNGGSIRCFVAHDGTTLYKDADHQRSLREIRVAEFDAQLDSDDPYRRFQSRAEQHKEDLSSLVRELVSSGKRIQVYGASTKGNTILQWCDLNNRLIEAAADRNPDKWGLVTPGTEIPIISEETSRKTPPDYYLVLPWHFREEFLQREHSLRDRGTKFIFPLPTIQII